MAKEETALKTWDWCTDIVLMSERAIRENDPEILITMREILGTLEEEEPAWVGSMQHAIVSSCLLGAIISAATGIESQPKPDETHH